MHRSPLNFVTLLGCTLTVVLWIGCGVQSTAPSADVQSQQEVESKTAAADSPASSEEVNLVVGDESLLQQTVDKHRGKVVLVDFWATWCQTCVQHFPETVELHNQHAREGLAAVTVNFDDLANAREVKEFLVESKAGGLDNLQSSYDGVGTEVPTAFDFEGVLPHYRLYDRTGKLRYRWDEPPADLKEKVAELLAESDAK